MSHRVLRGVFLLALSTGLIALPAHAQQEEEQQKQEGQETGYESAAHGMDAMMEAWQKAGAPGEPHQKLAGMAGDWNAEVRIWMDPAAEPMVSQGTMEGQMVMGGRYLEQTFRGDMMGEPFEGRQWTGYNNITGQYEANWVDNMSTAIFVYRGTMDGNTLTLEGEFRDPMSGETVKSRGVLEMVSDTEMRYTGYDDRGEGPVKTMEIVYTKQG